MFISVIIPTYNRLETLKRCLAQITNQSVDSNKYDVYIIDDCSKDNTPEFCEKYVKSKNNVYYHRNEENKGQASTRNVGIKLSKGELLVFLDNDLLVGFDFLKWILKYYDKYKDEKVVIVSNITYQPEVLATTNFGNHIQSRAIGYRSKKNRVNLDISDLPANFFAGGGSTCKREIANEIGLFDENLTKYGSEDELFGFRLKEVNTKIVFCPDAKIIHYDKNIKPQFWKVKYNELGRYSLRTLQKQEAGFVGDSLIRYILPVDLKNDGIKVILYKTFISLFTSPFFRKPVEKYIFATDNYRSLSCDFLFRYISAAWLKQGFDSSEKIQNVEY